MTRRRWVAAAVVCGALLLGACTDPSPDRPETTQTEAEPAPTEEESEPEEDVDPEFNDADVAGAEELLALDRTSIELHEIIQSTPGVDQDVQMLALSLHTTHYDQIGTLEQMLTTWGVLEEDEAPSGTDAATGGEGPDVVTPDEIEELREAEGSEAGELYLEHMIALHRQRSTVCEDILHDGQNQDLSALAQETLTTQQHELTHMQDLLDTLGTGSDEDTEA